MKSRLVLQRVLVTVLLGMLILAACTSEATPVQTSNATTPSTRLSSATAALSATPTSFLAAARQTLDVELTSRKALRTHVCTVDEVALTISVDPGWIESGPGSVSIQFVITNNGSKIEVDEKSDGPVIDIVVPYGYSGTPPPVVMHWSDLQPRDQIPHRLELKPGESYKIQMTYTSQIRSVGETVVGMLWSGTQYFPCSTGFVEGPYIR